MLHSFFSASRHPIPRGRTLAATGHNFSLSLGRFKLPSADGEVEIG
jgi:hypothetical protein